MRDKINVCFVAPIPPPYGGIANWTVLMLKYLKTSTEEVECELINIAPRKGVTEGRGLWERVVISGMDMFRKKRELKKKIEEKNTEVLHMTTSGQLAVFRDILLLKTARRKGVPAVYHIRFGRIPEIAEKNTREWKLISKAMRLASAVIAIDSRTFQTIRDRLPEVGAEYIPLPIDPNQLRVETKAVSCQKKTIMYLGWVIREKGIEELLKAWGGLHQRHQDWKLQIVGPSKKEYMAWLRENYSFEGVIYSGEKSHEEAMLLLNEADIFILPSYTEGFPNVILEAMIMGRAIIGTNVGAIPDMLAEGCGIVIAKGNANDLERETEYLIEHKEERERMGEQAAARVREQYLIDRICERYRRLWNDLAEKAEREKGRTV